MLASFTSPLPSVPLQSRSRAVTSLPFTSRAQVATPVAVISPSDGKPTRVGYKFEDGKKVRVCKRTGVELP